MRRIVLFAAALPAVTFAGAARADGPAFGAPPPDATALVSAPTAPPDAPKFESPTNRTTASVSAGGQATTGNSNMLAASVTAKYETRQGADGFGAAVLGNYGQAAPSSDPRGKEFVTAQNIQGRLRYDRYLGDRFSLFGMVTGRNDRFQGLAFRLNLDPGAKYLFVDTKATAFWGELGYDYEFAYHLDSASVDLNPPIRRKVADHSARAFLGVKHAFNKDVNLAVGAEYLQGFVKSQIDNLDYDSRFNFDALLAANLGAGLSIGVGFTALYDREPLPGKVHWDTTSTISLIYAFASAAPPPPAQKPPPPPPCVPEATTPPPPASGVAPPPPAAAAPPAPGSYPPPPATIAPPPPPPAGTAPSTTSPPTTTLPPNQ